MVLNQSLVTKKIMEYLNKHKKTYQNTIIKKDEDGDEIINTYYRDKYMYLSRGHSMPYLHAIVSVMHLPNDTSVQLKVLNVINELNSTINCCRIYSSGGFVYIGVFIHISSPENLEEFIGMCMGSIDYALDRFNKFMEINELEG